MRIKFEKEWMKLMIKRNKRIAQSYHYCECSGCGMPILTFIKKPKAYEFCSNECRICVLDELSYYE